MSDVRELERIYSLPSGPFVRRVSPGDLVPTSVYDQSCDRYERELRQRDRLIHHLRTIRAYCYLAILVLTAALAVAVLAVIVGGGR
jgi:hypothetical protein